MFGFYHFIHKIKTFGRFSLLLILLSCIQFFFLNNTQEFNQEVAGYHDQVRTSDQVAILYLEYCIRRVVDRNKCLFSKPFFKLKKRKRATKNSEVILNDMGRKFLQSEHYLSFYQKLLFETEEIKKLDSYPDFLIEKKKIYGKIQEIHKKYQKVSTFNKNILSVLRSFLTVDTFIQLLWFTFIFIIFGQVLELVVGAKIFGLSIFSGSVLAMYAYLNSVKGSEQVITGEYILISFLLGLCFGFGRRVYFYFHPKLKIRLRYVVTLLWAAQEILLHNYAPLITPHLAHFFALIFGLLFGFAYSYRHQLPYGFLSTKAWLYWQSIKEQPNLDYFLSVGNHILNENPDNYTVKKDLLIALLDTHVKGIDTRPYWNTLERILPDLISIYSLQESKEDLIIKTLIMVPEQLPFFPYLKKMKPKKYHVLLSLARRNQSNLIFIKLLESAFMHHRRKKDIINIEKLNLHALNFEDDKDALRKYVLNSPSKMLQEIMVPYLSK